MTVILIEPSGAGGIAHYTGALANALGTRGAECSILTGARWQSRSLPDRVIVHRVFRGARTNPFRVWTLCRRLRRTAAAVHWQSATHPRLLLWLMKTVPLKRIPWIYTVHNVLPHESSDTAKSLYEAVYRRMDGLIFHSEYSRRTFAECFPHIQRPSMVIPHGEYGFLASGMETEIPDTLEPVILFFGNIRPYKGLDTLIDAFAQVKQAIPGAKLIVAGQPLEPFSPYEERIQRFGLEDSVVKRLGYIPDDDIPKLFASAAAVALPYKEIDQSGVLLLALASGKAVVASRIGGIPEAVRDGETGILIPPGDTDALAKALTGLLNDPGKARALGANARQDVQSRFAWNDIADKTLAFYGQFGKK